MENKKEIDKTELDSYNKFTSESGHWYTQEGEPMYTIIGANGKERNTTLRDAKKENLVPSVTTILGMIAKPSLENWKINQIEQFPLCVVEIYNRWGHKLYTSDPGYTNPWNGLYKNSPLPVGTYYYIIELNDPKFPEPITGSITIIK